MEIKLTLDENLIIEFEALSKFWIVDKSDIIKPTIQEILRKYIIKEINKQRIEIATSEAASNTSIITNKDIII